MTTRNAVLKCLNADLLEDETPLAHAVRDALWAGGLTIDNFERYKASLDLMIRFGKQITQIAQIEMRTSREMGDFAVTPQEGVGT